ncbi:MAG: diguanylate cyclase response regulator [Gammaproteobacteria bacterium]|nr:MAG: diguanylate cyclase response regulator [Gammaproteobacteria bacterium]
MNVLIVDDQRLMREISKAVVESMGHTVFEAKNGEEALEIVQAEKIDLLLLDVEMPGINGFQTAKLIRDISAIWFPIIFLSAKVEIEFFVEGIRSGGDVYLYKPVIPEVLEAMIKAMERIVISQEELHHAKVKMERLAHRDKLTGLVNRRGFDNAISLELTKAKRDKTPLTIMMIDVDQFKQYNDNYGHQAGDDCLRRVAQQLEKALCRGFDIVARYGGEEFAIILPNTSLEQAKVVSTRIVQQMAEANIPHEFSMVADHVTISGGMAELDQHDTAKELVEAADKKLYLAKENGRNQVYA